MSHILSETCLVHCMKYQTLRLNLILLSIMPYRPISQTVFMLSIAINMAEHVCATVISKHN